MSAMGSKCCQFALGYALTTAKVAGKAGIKASRTMVIECVGGFVVCPVGPRSRG